MSDLNFLPKERVDSQRAEGVSGKFKVFAALLGFLCVSVGVGGSAYLFYRSNHLSQLQKQVDELKAQVVAQEATEQALIFVKDRLTKIKDLQAKNNSNALILADKTTFDSFPTDTELKQLELNQSAANFSILVPNSNSLKEVLEKMKSTEFVSGRIDTLSYSDQLGFQVKLKLK